ncbi:MAG: ATP-dependent DNA helicase, partial [Kofleriaceae bacterium]
MQPLDAIDTATRSAHRDDASARDYIDAVFGPDGLFAARFPGYETRDGQVALARTVDRAMREGRHALCEGPCGSGKSLAHAVPAVWHAHHRKKRVVIVTANIALQEQLVRKDLPMLTEVLPWPFKFALMKGRNNFVCRDRLADSEARGELDARHDDAQQSQLDDLLTWARRTTTGDLSELPFVPMLEVWSRVAVNSDECHGSSCAYRATCFSERAMQAARDADLIVTNYHLLFAHLVVRRETGEDLILPPFDLLVLDEAHEAADIARGFFGFTVSELSVRRLAGAADAFGDPELGRTLRHGAKTLFEAVGRYARSSMYQARLSTAGFVDAGTVVAALRALSTLALGFAGDEDADPVLRARVRNVRRQAQTVASRLSEVVAQSEANKVYFIEIDAKGRSRLGAKTLDVGGVLRAELFDRASSVTLMSATMTTGGSFDFVRTEVGAPAEALELVAESPFDFARQALLIIPRGLPDPRDPSFVEAVADAVTQVIRACDGRTLGLFTSYRNLNAVYDRIASIGHRILRQGELPRTELARLFKEDVGSVLLGTESFWTGIDVPGPALTALVIDKLPFPNMDDPVVSAICAGDPRAFGNYLVPRAIIMLRQGIGRLIRSQADVGVAVILDRRIADKPYGRRFLQSLPSMMTTRNLDNIGRFLDEAKRAIGG